MRTLRRLWTTFVCLAFPASVKPCLLWLAGHRVHRSARIGVSLIRVDRLYLGRNARIGQLNLLRARRLVMREHANIGHLNWVSGDISISLAERAAIGHRNHINAGTWPGLRHRPQLRLGVWAKITTGHFVNACESVTLGKYTTLAGFGSQLWTHGYVHMSEGLERAEVRGKITIGDNVYIGSNCTLQAGIRIANAVSVGAHASVAKSLLEPGVYVPQELRYLRRSPEDRLAGLDQITPGSNDRNPVYWRGGGGALTDSALKSRLAKASDPQSEF